MCQRQGKNWWLDAARVGQWLVLVILVAVVPARARGACVGCVDLHISNTAYSPASPRVALPLTYSITIAVNPTAPSVVVADELPSSVTFVSATTSAGSCSQACGTVTCSLGSVTAGTVTVTVVPTQTGPLADIVGTAAMTPDGNLTNDTSVISVANVFPAQPVVSSVAPSSGTQFGGTPVTITGSGFVPGVTVTFGGQPATNVTLVSSSVITCTTPAGAPGEATVTVTDPDGYSGNGQFDYLVTPVVTGVSPSAGALGGGTLVTVTGSGFVNVTSVMFGGNPATNISVGSGGTSLTCHTPAHGAGTVSITVTNQNGMSGTGAAYTYEPAPTVISVAPNPVPATLPTYVIITGANFLNNPLVAFQIGTQTYSGINPKMDSSTSISVQTPNVGASGGSATVIVTNNDGQIGSLANGLYFSPVPIVTSVSPSSGPMAGGTFINIYGQYFEHNTGNQTQVQFTAPGFLASFYATYQSSTQLFATTPAGPDGPVNVTVINVDGQQGILVNGFMYVAPPPTVTAITPSHVPATIPTPVTITGTNFQSGATVALGPAAPTNVVVVSGTSITAVTPTETPGTVNVTVTNPDTQYAVLANGLTFDPPPSISSLVPSSGSTIGGTAVQIYGSNFRSGAVVQFGSSSFIATTFVNATKLLATTPPGRTGPVTVTVKNPDAQTGALANGFTYVPPPTVVWVDPTIGSPGGDTNLTIIGTDFQSGATVVVGKLSATNVVFIDSTHLSAKSPAGSGTVSVEVINPDGQTGTLANGYTYGATSYYLLTPCTVIDTRNPDGTYGGPALVGGAAARSFPIPGNCGVPTTARAILINATVTETGAAGDITIWPGGIPQPGTLTVTYPLGATVADNATVNLGRKGEISVYCDQVPNTTTQLIVDIYGYLQ